MATVRRSRGFPRVFSAEQNDALRSALREFHGKKKISQASIGELLGVAQQAVARLLRSEEAGFSYDTATRLARVVGYASVDSFFRAKGVATPSDPPQAKSA